MGAPPPLTTRPLMSPDPGRGFGVEGRVPPDPGTVDVGCGDTAPETAALVAAPDTSPPPLSPEAPQDAAPGANPATTSDKANAPTTVCGPRAPFTRPEVARWFVRSSSAQVPTSVLGDTNRSNGGNTSAKSF